MLEKVRGFMMGTSQGQVLTTLKRAKIRGRRILFDDLFGEGAGHFGRARRRHPARRRRRPLGSRWSSIWEMPCLRSLSHRISPEMQISWVWPVKLRQLSRQPLRQPSYDFQAEWSVHIEGKVSILIKEPELNPRFVLGLIQDIKTIPSPYWVQRRLRLAGMRPINNIVDATNYAMLEVGRAAACL